MPVNTVPCIIVPVNTFLNWEGLLKSPLVNHPFEKQNRVGSDRFKLCKKLSKAQVGHPGEVRTVNVGSPGHIFHCTTLLEPLRKDKNKRLLYQLTFQGIKQYSD